MVTSRAGQMPAGATKNAVPVSETEAETRHVRKFAGYAQWWELPGGVRLKLFGFPPNGADLRPEHHVVLVDAADFLRGAPERKVWVVGHADGGEGTTSKNQALSERRAYRVWDFLSGKGIKKDQLYNISRGAVIGWGDTLSAHAAGEPDYDPAEYRMVEVCLFKNTIDKYIREHYERLRREGYNV
jgi:outer membrane protein OmpA-like peptidoglycan-associated protein